MQSEETPKSRTQLKKEALAIQKMGEKLVMLSDDQLTAIPLPSELAQAIQDIRRMTSRGARRRQMQFIGALMRHVDLSAVRQSLLEIEQGAYQQAKAFHRIEAWRDGLIEGDESLLERILKQCPAANRQRLGQLIRGARREKAKGLPSKSARNLFRYLKELASV
jgi:ribosome-associated protein